MALYRIHHPGLNSPFFRQSDCHSKHHIESSLFSNLPNFSESLWCCSFVTLIFQSFTNPTESSISEIEAVFLGLPEKCVWILQEVAETQVRKDVCDRYRFGE